MRSIVYDCVSNHETYSSNFPTINCTKKTTLELKFIVSDILILQ